MKYLVILSFIVFAATACRHISGSGNIVSEKKSVGNFTGISAGSGFDVEVHIGSPVSVTIDADDNLMKMVKVRVEDRTLQIHTKNGVSISDGHLKAYITVPSLDYIESTGAATINVLDELKDDKKIKLHASGAAKIAAHVDAPKIEAESSGAANIDVTGRTKDFNAHASGGAGIDADELMSENTDAEASGAANVHVYASVKLNAHASGAGNIFYKGEAAVSKETSGAGNVNKAN